MHSFEEYLAVNNHAINAVVTQSLRIIAEQSGFIAVKDGMHMPYVKTHISYGAEEVLDEEPELETLERAAEAVERDAAVFCQAAESETTSLQDMVTLSHYAAVGKKLTVPYGRAQYRTAAVNSSFYIVHTALQDLNVYGTADLLRITTVDDATTDSMHIGRVAHQNVLAQYSSALREDAVIQEGTKGLGLTHADLYWILGGHHKDETELDAKLSEFRLIALALGKVQDVDAALLQLRARAIAKKESNETKHAYGMLLPSSTQLNEMADTLQEL